MPARSRNWLWFFAALVALASAAIGINWWYNLRQQLTLDQLAAARQRWKDHGPADYDLTVEKLISSAASDGEPIRETIVARVRRGAVLAATLDGRPMEKRLLADYDMPAWFGYVEEFLDRDLKPNAPRTFRTAVFDPLTGALQHFRRRVSGTRERQELRLRVAPPS